LGFDEASPVFNQQARSPMTQSLHTKPKPSIALPSRPRAPQQLPMTFESTVLQELTSSERASVVAQLALLLLQAAGMGAGDDDGEL
jgi:hypothetical protein